jgi:uncharacterized protein (DUF697 family)
MYFLLTTVANKRGVVKLLTYSGGIFVAKLVTAWTSNTTLVIANFPMAYIYQITAIQAKFTVIWSIKTVPGLIQAMFLNLL